MSSVSFALSICFCFGSAVERAHVVEAVGQLDQDHPDVGGHRDHHLAVVLGLLLVAALEGDAGELRDAVDELGDVVAEALAHVVERRARVLDGVVQQRRADRLGVEAHAGADLRHADRVGDELLARLAALVGVALAGEGERLADALEVDRADRVVGVLRDDREQVGEQLLLVRQQVGADVRRRRRRGGRPLARRRRGRARPGAASLGAPAASRIGSPERDGAPSVGLERAGRAPLRGSAVLRASVLSGVSVCSGIGAPLRRRGAGAERLERSSSTRFAVRDRASNGTA